MVGCLTFATLQRDTQSVSEVVGGAAVEAAVEVGAHSAVDGAHLTPLPPGMEETLWTHVTTLPSIVVPVCLELVLARQRDRHSQFHWQKHQYKHTDSESVDQTDKDLLRS